MTNYELKQIFSITGYFYVHNQTECRKYLHIKRKEDYTSEIPDLMVIMMNPGSSHPLDGNNNGRMQTRTEPDHTQYAIMKVMDAIGFKFARVLNLSDYRDQDSGIFVKNITVIDKLYPEHSIFHPDRTEEIKKLFEPNAKLLVAWGCKPALAELASQALKTLSPAVIIGIKHPTIQWAYYHPLQRTFRGWVDKVVANF